MGSNGLLVAVLLAIWLLLTIVVQIRPRLHYRLRWIRPLFALPLARLFAGPSLDFRIQVRLAGDGNRGAWSEVPFAGSGRYLPLLWNPDMWGDAAVATAARTLRRADEGKLGRPLGPAAEARAVIEAFLASRFASCTGSALQVRIVDDSTDEAAFWEAEMGPWTT